MNKKEELLKEIKETEEKLSKLKARLEKVNTDPTFERVGIGENYYSLSTLDGSFFIVLDSEMDTPEDRDCFNKNNYFHSAERASEVLDKIKFLLKIERLHDNYCPEYTPNFEADLPKYFILYNHTNKKYFYSEATYWWIQSVSQVYFPSAEIAKKVCDRLSK